MELVSPHYSWTLEQLYWQHMDVWVERNEKTLWPIHYHQYDIVPFRFRIPSIKSMDKSIQIPLGMDNDYMSPIGCYRVSLACWQKRTLLYTALHILFHSLLRQMLLELVIGCRELEILEWPLMALELKAAINLVSNAKFWPIHMLLLCLISPLSNVKPTASGMEIDNLVSSWWACGSVAYEFNTF